MNITGIVSILAVLAASPAAAATLSELADKAAARSAGVEAMSARARQAEAGAQEARLMRLPSVTGRVMATRGDDPVYAFGSLLQQRAFTMNDFAVDRLNRPGYRTNVKSSLEAGVPLFTAFELETHDRLGRLAAEQARKGESGEAQRARHETAQAFLSALSKKEALAVLEERIRLAGEDVASARRLKERGLVLGADFMAAEAVLEGLRAWRARLEGELESERARLAVLTGDPAADPQGTLREPSYSVDVERLAEMAAERRPDAAAARLETEAAEAEAKRARWSLAPRVEAFAALETNTKDFGAMPSSRLFGARASLPFGDAGYGARRRRAKSAVEAGRAEERRTAEAAQVQVRQAAAGYKAASASLAPLAAMKERAAASAEAFRPLYREGRQSVLEALRAHEAAARASVMYLEAAAAAHAAYAGVRIAAGTLEADAVREISLGLEAAK